MQIKRYASNIFLLLFFQMLLFCYPAVAQDATWLDTTFITLDVNEKPRNDFIALLEKQCNCFVNIRNDEDKPYTLRVQHETMRHVLNNYFKKKRGLKWKLTTEGVALWKKGSSNAADNAPAKPTIPPAPVKQPQVQGWVTDLHGEPLPGVSVRIKATQQGATTDGSGYFALDAGNAVVTLIFRLGYNMVEMEGSAAKKMRVSLNTEMSLLDQVTVNGYFNTSRRFSTSVTATIQSADIDRYPVGTITGILQGRVKGLTITPSNGATGATSKIVIRGKNSLFNKPDPLLLVNKVPWASGNEPLNNFSSVITQNTGGGISSLTTLNPEIIESIDVLKDGAATAIYGSRGANGVISVTTKTARVDGLQASAKVATGFTAPAFKYTMLSTPEYVAVRREGFYNDGLVPDTIPGHEGYAVDLADTISNTNWQQMLIGHRALRLDGNVSILTGASNTRARIDLGYHQEATPFSAGMTYKNTSLYSWVQTTMANGRIGFKSSFYLSGDENKAYDGSLWSLFTRPNLRMYNADGSLHWGDGPETKQNPMADRLKRYKIWTNNILYNAAVTYALSPRIALKLNTGYSAVLANEQLLLPIAAQPPVSSGVITGSSFAGSNRFQSFIAEPMAEYATNDIKLLIGGSCQYATHNGNSYAGRGYTNDALLDNISLAAYYSDSSDASSEYKYASLFGQVHYKLRDRYMANLTYRMDGSSRFSPEHRFGHFGAIGAGWIFSEEPFMKAFRKIVEYGKLMASYGVTGNDQIGNYQYLDIWGPSNGIPFQGMAGYSPESLYNSAYSWERCRKFDVSMDLQFARGLWLLSVSYFLNRSDKQLVQVNLPAQTGFNTVLKNFDAVIENRGWELSLDGNLFKSPTLQISTGINLSLPKNRLLPFKQPLSTPSLADLLINKPVSSLNVYQYAGVDKQTGVSLLQDIDGDGNITDKDRAYIGHLDPVLFGGVSLVVKWKGWELSVFGEYKKQMVPSYTYNSIMGDLLPGTAVNLLTLANDRWRKPGDEAAYPKASTRKTSPVHANRHLVAASSQAYTDGSFFKMRNAYIAYTISSPWLSNKGIQSIKGFVKGRNLFTLSSYPAGDPETANLFAMPMLRTIEAGFQVNFNNFLQPINK